MISRIVRPRRGAKGCIGTDDDAANLDDDYVLSNPRSAIDFY